MRTTVEINDPILRSLKELQRMEGRSLGHLTSDPLAQALAERLAAMQHVPGPSFEWEANPMDSKVDLLDKNALLDLMDGS